MRFLLLMLLLVFLSIGGMFMLSNYLSVSSFSVTNRTELEHAIDQADVQLSSYQKGEISQRELDQMVNPVLNANDVFFMLLSPQKEVTAYTNNAVAYFGIDHFNVYLDRLDNGKTVFTPEENASGMVLLLAEKTENGYIFAGKPLRTFYGATSKFRLTMLTWILPLTALLFFICLLALRIMARPAVLLTEAASRLSKGEMVLLDDDLPGEIGQVARTFNQMSANISSAISALNNEKEGMRKILEGLSEGILAIDMCGNIIHENAAAVALLGDESNGAYNEVLSALKSSLLLKNDVTEKIFQKDKILQYTITHLKEEDQNKGTIALIRDITEQERLENTRHDYVANISHELRTPLANMRGLAEGLRDGMVQDEKDKLRYYGMIVDEIKRLSRLVNDLLELSGLQSNPATFEMEKVYPTELMWELYELNNHLFKEKNQTLTLDIPEEEMPLLITNEDRVSQVLTIFLDNARKYTLEGGKVCLKAEVLKEGICFSVSDTGIGMDEETQRSAFDRFHQAEKSHANKGSGLGLSIAKEILKKMDIPVSLKSQKNVGSTFSFVLPFKKKI